jgi:hypothetical protein
MRLLANDRPITIEGSKADAVLGELSRFTAVMMCVVSTLEVFATWGVVKTLLKEVLRELLRTSEFGEDMLAAQYVQRLNAWRSAACVRSLSLEAARYRQELLKSALVVPGLMPAGEAKHMVDFLVWLLAGQGDLWRTSSSDVAGVAACMAHLGVDVVSVSAEGYPELSSPCHVYYGRDVLLHNAEERLGAANVEATRRSPSSNVSLKHPEEAVTIFPLSLANHERCRRAWQAGARSSVYIEIGVVLPDKEGKRFLGEIDVMYSFSDAGTEPARLESANTFGPASEFAVAINQQILEELQRCLQDETSEIMEWLCLKHARDTKEEIEMANETAWDSGSKTLAFSVLQSFFLGYWYSLLLRLVDTSSLGLQVVEGSWNFQSAQILEEVRQMLVTSRQGRKTDKSLPAGTLKRVLTNS